MKAAWGEASPASPRVASSAIWKVPRRARGIRRLRLPPRQWPSETARPRAVGSARRPSAGPRGTPPSCIQVTYQKQPVELPGRLSSARPPHAAHASAALPSVPIQSPTAPGCFPAPTSTGNQCCGALPASSQGTEVRRGPIGAGLRRLGRPLAAAARAVGVRRRRPAHRRAGAHRAPAPGHTPGLTGLDLPGSGGTARVSPVRTRSA